MFIQCADGEKIYYNNQKEFYRLVSQRLWFRHNLSIKQIVELFGNDRYFEVDYKPFFAALTVENDDNLPKVDDNGIVDYYIKLLIDDEIVHLYDEYNTFVLKLLRRFNVSKETELKLINLVDFNRSHGLIGECIIHNKTYWNNLRFCNAIGVNNE